MTFCTSSTACMNLTHYSASWCILIQNHTHFHKYSLIQTHKIHNSLPVKCINLYRTIKMEIYIQSIGCLSQTPHETENHSNTFGDVQCSLCTRRHRLQYIMSIALAQPEVLSDVILLRRRILREGELPAQCRSTAVPEPVSVQHFAPLICMMSVLVHKSAKWLVLNHAALDLLIFKAFRCFPRPLCLGAASNRTWYCFDWVKRRKESFSIRM